MSYEKVKQAKKTIIGTKQTVKAIRAGIVTEVIIAMDAEERFITPLWRKPNFTISGDICRFQEATWKSMWYRGCCSRRCNY